MVKYYYKKDTFVIEDYQNAKTFSSFFPAVSGLKGKPLWTFYCSRGQAMSSFGVQSKATPIIPFDSANLAYQNINLKSFRTFLKIDNKFVEPFSTLENHTTLMEIDKAKLTISELEDEVSVKVVYSTVPSSPYSALIRKVCITNTSSRDLHIELVDGLPIFFPHGLSNGDYKELVSLMAAYCQIENLENNMPFVKFKTSTSDCSEVKPVESGNGFVSITSNGKRLKSIVDAYLVFKDDLSLRSPNGFLKDSEKYLTMSQQQENKLPCAFSYDSFTLKPGCSYDFISFFGKFDNIDIFNKELGSISFAQGETFIKETDKLIEDLLSPVEISTSNHLFDMCAKQSLLDNNLRGGFPIEIVKGSTYYVYGRKHGDMERDYNFFQISDSYFSCGEGNFRDVNQNRRSDIYYYPFVKDYNIKIFFDLIQLDGQNPLSVRPLTFKINDSFDLNSLNDYKLITILKEGYEPSKLYTYLKDIRKEKDDSLFEKLISESHQNVEADFREGYWIDHWTYNVDLLHNFVSVFPDKVEELLFRDDYHYFYSPVFVEPREEKYCLLNDGRIRQYGAINLKKLKYECEKLGFDIKKTAWAKDQDGNVVSTTLASKIINLIGIKFSTLDSQQMGIEMECEKPGWNDAMNGLPGLFASSLGETVELLRLIEFFLDYARPYEERSITLLTEQFRFLKKISKYIRLLKNKTLSSFEYWDAVTNAREHFREITHLSVSGEVQVVKLKAVFTLLEKMRIVLTRGIKAAKAQNGGILPSYLVYDVVDYKKTDHVNHLGYKTIVAKKFELVKLPLFLEASARSFKMGSKITSPKDYRAIKKTDLYDKKLHIYKTCADLDSAPFEIGRVHAFTKGWLERECDFLHMTYKYLLGLLKGGYYKEFYKECKTNLVFNMDPYVYGRNPVESSSFIVPTCNPDEKLHGQGFFARLTGANAEFLDMINTMLFGEHLFLYENDVLSLNLDPKLDASLFKEDGSLSFKLLNKITVTYLNPHHINTYESHKRTYIINDVKYDQVKGELAEKIRAGEIDKITMVIE